MLDKDWGVNSKAVSKLSNPAEFLHSKLSDAKRKAKPPKLPLKKRWSMSGFEVMIYKETHYLAFFDSIISEEEKTRLLGYLKSFRHDNQLERTLSDHKYLLTRLRSKCNYCFKKLMSEDLDDRILAYKSLFQLDERYDRVSDNLEELIISANSWLNTANSH